MSMVPPASLSREGDGRPRIGSIFSSGIKDEVPITDPRLQAPTVGPPREMKGQEATSEHPPVELDLIEWANSHLSAAQQITPRGSICGGLELLRIAESIKGLSDGAVPDCSFYYDRLNGLLNLFDLLIDNDVNMGAICINDVRLGKRDKIIQVLKALRKWEERRKADWQSIKNYMEAVSFVR